MNNFAKICFRIYKPVIWFLDLFKKINDTARINNKIAQLVTSPSFCFKIGQNCKISADLIINIEKDSKIIIGDNVTIWERSIIQAKNGGILNIGNGTRIGRDCNLCAHKQIIVGNEVLFSSYIWVVDHQHKFDLSRPVSFYSYSKLAPIKIGNGVMIGNKVTITQDVNIGNFSIIGANSVVTKSIPSKSIAAGIPAKIIRINAV